MTEEKKEGALDMIMDRIDKIEKQMEEICKKQKMLQDAFYKIYEETRRRERKL
jgi:CII-binding regulator of phage lambda lysogenization HflD